MADPAALARAPAPAKAAEPAGDRAAEARHEGLEGRLQIRAERDYAEMLGGRPAAAVQRKATERLSGRPPGPRPAQPPARPNRTGLPDRLKSGIEALSGMSMDAAKVHYNSPKPAQLDALAYAQGTDIHLAPGQERHLPHEAWHLVQQAQGRVRPTMQMKSGVPVNDDAGLEHEAEMIGARAIGPAAHRMAALGKREAPPAPCAPTIQRMILPVWSKDKDKSDFLDQGKRQSEKLGHGKVINVSNWIFDKNLSGLGNKEDLHIIGHGNPASIANMTPDELAEALVTLKLPATFGGEIYLEACESGSEIVDLKGSYAERFAVALAKLRPEAKQQPNLVAYKGAVVLDDTFKGREMMRVLHKGVELQAFKVTAVKANSAAQKEISKLLEIIEKEKLKLFIDDTKILEYNFLYYNQLISQLAEPAGGSLTQHVRGGKAEASSSVSLMDPDEFIAPILEKARKDKAEIDNIKVEYLDLSDLGPIIVNRKDQKQEKEKPKDIKQKPELTETKQNS